ncbi:Doc1 [Kluyveromyces lactis]|nr:Doc1 [Kluyveromyces lactis]
MVATTMSTDKELFKRLQSILPRWENPYEVFPISQHVILDADAEDSTDENVQYVSNVYNPDEPEDQEESLESYLKRYTTELELLEQQNLVNLTKLAFWKASSFKVGNPIENAIDDDPTTFWQSDGLQPHRIDINFSKRVDVVQLAMYFCLVTDESYTPELFKVYAGYSPSDASLYRTFEVKNVNGWVVITFKGNRPHDNLLRCRFIQIQILSNHENGKDSHLRGIKIFGNSTASRHTMNDPNTLALDNFENSSLFAYQSIR